MNEKELLRYFSRDLGWGDGYQSRKVFAFLREVAALASGGAMLDAGAGHQRYRPFFSECLYLAQEHPIAGQQNKGLDKFDILCDVRTIPLQDNCLSAVLSTSSLEHMEFPEQFFHESFRTLAPGGGLFVHVPFIYAEHEVPYDFQRPTRYGLERWYKAAGFERVEVEPVSNSMTTFCFWLGVALVEEQSQRWGTPRRFSPRWWKGALERRMVRVMCSRLEKRWGDAPHESTTAPVGWIARGFKAGTLKPKGAESVEEFLASYGDGRVFNS